jgi:uncharacterized protein YyaL (SSP411 family)
MDSAKAGGDMLNINSSHWSCKLIFGFVVFALGSAQCVVAQENTGKPKPRANRLAKESSPYLLLHAHNPVDWFPWGPEAFEKAKKEGKLIFLSVGYSSCYWCHVMERKVFMNDAIAKTLNSNFVCIKVDREERPDIDDIYMTALQVYYQMIGAPSSGGWPLSMFLTPDGKPVAGGTYFPPEDAQGIQGFPSILDKLVELWTSKQEQMEANAEIVANETRRLMRPKVSLKPVEINEKLVETAFLATSSSFDTLYGGIDFNSKRPDGPKFPTPAKLNFVQKSLLRKPNADVSKLVELTLTQMACGGIRDHIGGGFHRYSVDRQWNVPHFEKMLYDQAQLADVYVEAFRTTHQTLYKQVAEELLEYVAREMTSPEGAFFSALDAETDGIEGEYYVWDASEIDNVLASTSAAFKSTYRVKDLADFEHGNVLRLSSKRLPMPAPAQDLLADQTLAGSEQDEFTLARKKLLEVRNKRKKPLRDEKILTCWNGLMIGAYARAASPLQHPEYARTAERAANFLLDNLRDPQGRLLHAFTAGQAKLNAYLDDYAFLIDGLLALHDATDDPKWLKAAKQLQDEQLRLFLDETNGGFFFTSHHHEELLARTKNSYDGVLPAGNSVSARNLIKLAKLTGITAYRDEARATIELFAANMEQMPRGLTNLALAAMELLDSETDGQGGTASPAANEVVQVSGANQKATSQDPLVILADQKDAQPKKEEIVKARAYLSTDKLRAGGTSQIVVLLEIKEGWHINANPPEPDHMIPTKVTFKSKLGTKLSEVVYPKGHSYKFEGEEEVQAYEKEVAIHGTLTVPDKTGGQSDDMEISITYQACKEKECLPPKTIKLLAKLGVAGSGDAVKSINARLFSKPAK